VVVVVVVVVVVLVWGRIGCKMLVYLFKSFKNRDEKATRIQIDQIVYRCKEMGP